VFVNPAGVEEQEVAIFETVKSSILSKVVQMPLYRCACSDSSVDYRKKQKEQKEHIKEQVHNFDINIMKTPRHCYYHRKIGAATTTLFLLSSFSVGSLLIAT
jgi:hypothetical protein